MLPFLLTVWHFLRPILADPVFDAVCFMVIILAEVHAVWHNRIQTKEAKKQTALADDTYKLYKTYFEVTEKRKADWREAQRRSRAAKKERLHPAPEPEPEVVEPPEEPVPPPTNGHVPPLVLPEEEEQPPIEDDGPGTEGGPYARHPKYPPGGPE